MVGQRGDRLEAHRAGFADPQAFGDRVGLVCLLRRLPCGASVLRLLLGLLETDGKRMLRIPSGGQIHLLCLKPGSEGVPLLVGTSQRFHVSLAGQRVAGSFGLLFGAGRIGGLLLAGRDPLIGGGDLVRQSRHPGRHADGRQQPGLSAHGVGRLSRLAGLFGSLVEGLQPAFDGPSEFFQIPDAGSGPFLGFLRGIGELGPLFQREAHPFGREPGAIPGLLPDLLVDAERQQFDEQRLALARLRLEEVGEPALRQQHRLDEMVVGEPQDVLDLRLDRVGALGEVVDAGAEDVG